MVGKRRREGGNQVIKKHEACPFLTCPWLASPDVRSHWGEILCVYVQQMAASLCQIGLGQRPYGYEAYYGSNKGI